MTKPRLSDLIVVRNTRREDVDHIIEISRKVYPGLPWSTAQLHSHLEIFPAGQLVAVDTRNGRVVGMASSLIVLWDDYDFQTNWKDFTGAGYFTNHDPDHGRTLYGAEVMVDPEVQRMGIGKRIYAARRELCRSLGLKRIRAGARLRGYHAYADRMSPEEYAIKVVNRELADPTLTFQIRQGFRVLAVVRDYFRGDEESRGHAAVIEWANHQAGTRRDFAGRDPRFGRRRARHARGDRTASGTSAERPRSTTAQSQERGAAPEPESS